MRNRGRVRMGYFPLALREAQRIRTFLKLPDGACAVLDPCAGCGTALVEVTSGGKAIRYGIELDAYRAEQARIVLDHVIHGSCFDVHCPVESYSLLALNAPYDWECGESRNERLEYLFLDQTFRWLKHAGVLVMIVSGPRLSVCSDILAVHFRDKAIYRLTESEAVEYQQIVVFGVRRNPRERGQLKDSDVARAKGRLNEIARHPEQLAQLPDQPDRCFVLPPSEPVSLVYRGIPLDTVEDVLPRSTAYRQAARILFCPPNRAAGRPLTVLHPGHVGIVAVSGMLDGCLGSGDSRHLATWTCVKVVDKIEEVEDGVTTIRERERFTQTLTLAFHDGRTAILTDGTKGAG
jgi:hypothetical protein